jgi:hypothetical protein
MFCPVLLRKMAFINRSLPTISGIIDMVVGYIKPLIPPSNTAEIIRSHHDPGCSGLK